MAVAGLVGRSALCCWLPVVTWAGWLPAALNCLLCPTPVILAVQCRRHSMCSSTVALPRHMRPQRPPHEAGALHAGFCRNIRGSLDQLLAGQQTAGGSVGSRFSSTQTTWQILFFQCIKFYHHCQRYQIHGSDPYDDYQVWVSSFGLGVFGVWHFLQLCCQHLT